MRSRLKEFADRHLPLIESELRNRLPQSSLPGGELLNQAVRYAVFSGGKRIRPLLTLVAADVSKAPLEPALKTACGVEFLHLSSVIIDDLPAMDDAKMRRHVPALHIAYGEGIALLAALALYTKGFESFVGAPGLVEEATRVVGCDGMIGGQAADLQGMAASRLEKTTALMRFAMSAGGRAGGAPPEQLVTLGQYGELIGEAFQICDDLLDVLASETRTGKTGGQDSRHGRHALPREFGVERAFARAQALTERAIADVRRQLPDSGGAELLCEFAESLIERVADLVKNNGPACNDSCAGGARGGQRCVLAAREEGDEKPDGSPVDSDPRA